MRKIFFFFKKKGEKKVVILKHFRWQETCVMILCWSRIVEALHLIIVVVIAKAVICIVRVQASINNNIVKHIAFAEMDNTLKSCSLRKLMPS